MYFRAAISSKMAVLFHDVNYSYVADDRVSSGILRDVNWRQFLY